ncbi:MAG TPA: ATP-dependent zinc metalloprotease FtsH [Planctomycetota bacterium]|nr:ATP-dependent zinc metalloprotease FtsH [Planctomycetota bacterium]
MADKEDRNDKMGNSESEGSPRSRVAKRRAPSGLLIFLVILFVALILITMGRSLAGGGEVKDVSLGTLTSYLTTGLETLTEQRRGEILKGYAEIPDLGDESRAKLMGTIAKLSYDNVTLQQQRDALKREVESVPGLSPAQAQAAKQAVDRVWKIAQEDLDKNRKVKKIVVEGTVILAELNVDHKEDNKPYRKIRATVPRELSENAAFLARLQAAVGDAKNFDTRTPSPLPDILLQLIPWVFLILIIYFFFFRTMRSAAGPGSVLNFSRSRARLITPDHVKVSFDDVAGVDEAKEDVKEVVEFLKHPKKFRRLGGRIPRGILLVGPPGTGKTLLAKAIAGESGVPFFSISGSDFVEMFVGVGAGRVRDLFRQAREQSPCVVFLDEIDAVGRRRGSGLGGGHDEREQTLNQILVEMDGFGTDENVIVLAATNRPDILDPALLRPGRFDREVMIDLPDVKGREAILKVHVKKIRLREGTDLSVVARATPGCSGADLAAVINEGAIIATLRNKDEVGLEELEEGRDKVMFGRQKRSRVMDESEKRVTAYHEAGHALVAQLLYPMSDPVHKVTIIPRGMSLGSTMRLPERDRYILQRGYFNAALAVLFGGRAAEENFFDDISNGARDDIKKATDLARAMVTEWGMSEVMGPVAYSNPEEHLFLGREVTRTTQHSEKTSQLIDQEVRRLVDDAHAKARDLIKRNKDKLDKIAEALLKYETISGDEVAAVLRGEDIATIRSKVAAQPA